MFSYNNVLEVLIANRVDNQRIVCSQCGAKGINFLFPVLDRKNPTIEQGNFPPSIEAFYLVQCKGCKTICFFDSGEVTLALRKSQA